jgi:hypothetical protein
MAAFSGDAMAGGVAGVATLAVIPVLALIGGLAAACFVKAFGVVFLGKPRTPAAHAAGDPPLAMRGAMLVGAALCIAIGLWPGAAFALVAGPAAQLSGTATSDAMLGGLVPLTRIALVLVGIAAALAMLRSVVVARREVTLAPTWGCGYEAPTSRMQYTAASFAEPLLDPFAPVLHRPVHEEPVAGWFPVAARHERHPGDAAGERVVLPVVRRFVALLSRTHIVQHGRVHLYLVYILATVVALLLWQLSGAGS